MSKANQNHLSNYEVETAVMQRFDSNEFFLLRRIRFILQTTRFK